MTHSNDTTTDTNYTLCTELVFSFSLYEDRLIAQALRKGTALSYVLFTRRMTMLVVQQLLKTLPRLTDLGRTPAEYWQETLRMNHERAMKAREPVNALHQQPLSAEPSVEAVPAVTHDTNLSIFIATEITIKFEEHQVIMAFRGLPMSQAMTQPQSTVPLFAIPLQVDHVHQLIELLIVKAREAQWHLPVELPWLEPLKPSDVSGHRLVLH